MTLPPLSAPPRRARAGLARRPRGSRGFTLVELMVAVSAGLFFSVIVFVLARDTANFYQEEARIADATLSSIIGFERLQADVARSGYLVSPNVRSDPKLCGQRASIAGTWPVAMRRLAAFRVDQEGSAGSTQIDDNLGRQPDSILLMGSYSSLDRFPTSGVENAPGGPVVSLLHNTGPMARLGYNTLPSDTDRGTLLDSLFPAGRALRLVDDTGHEQYAVIASTQTGTPPTITLATVPGLTFRGNNPTVCGLRALQPGTVNVVDFIRYDVGSLADTTGYSALYGAVETRSPWEAGRTELVRTELAPDGTTVLGQEIVAEFAVDLTFGLTLASIVGSNATGLTQLAPGNAQIGQVAGPTAGTDTPQLVRAIAVALSVRGRAPDRANAALDPAQPNFASNPNSVSLVDLDLPLGLYRWGLGPQGGAPYTRVRTLQATVPLANQAEVVWQ